MHPITDAAGFLFSPVEIGVAAIVWLLLITGIPARVLLYFQELRHLRAAAAKLGSALTMARLFSR